VGTVTFLFTDIEGSTKLVQALGDQYRELLSTHCRILRSAIEREGGIEIGTEGDSFFAVFSAAAAGMAATAAAQRALDAATWPAGTHVRVRMGLHTGEGTLGGEDYIGLDVHRAARIAAAGHGLAAVLIAMGEPERGVLLLGANAAIRERLGGGPPPEWLRLGDPLTDARRSLGEDAYTRAWDAGSTMSVDETVGEALKAQH